jgi:hypothetical protein
MLRVLASTLVLLPASLAYAQEPLFETAGPPGAAGYGCRLTGLGDVNGDGLPDVAVADASAYVRVHSGADWSVLLESGPWHNIITSLGALDSDGDGPKELVVAHQVSTNDSEFFVDLVDVSSGASRWQYYDFQFIGEAEARLVDAGDLDGDGLNDLLLGVPDYDLWHPAWWESGIHALRGTDGADLGAVYHNPGGMGEGVVVVGDVNGDGTPDFAVGAPLDGTARGMVEVRDGASPHLVLWHRDGALAGAELGEALASVGDLDGDGLSEIAALENGELVDGGPARDLRVQVLAGADGAQLHSREFPGEGHAANLHEVELETVADLDGDGREDLMMSVPRAPWGGPVVRVLSGADLETLHQWALVDQVSTGLPSAVLADWDADGNPELIVGDPARGATGWVTVLPSERSVGTLSCGPAVANSTGRPARLRVAGSGTAAANDIYLLGFDLPPNQWVLPLAAPATGSVPHIGGGAGTLCLGGTIRRLNAHATRTDPAGGYLARLDLSEWHSSPPAPMMAGETWYFQLWYRDPAAGTSSNLSDATEVIFD